MAEYPVLIFELHPRTTFVSHGARLSNDVRASISVLSRHVAKAAALATCLIHQPEV